MRCWDIPLFPAALIGLVVAVGYYIVIRIRCSSVPEVRPSLESALCGYGTISGLHLLFSSFCPEHLVHVSVGDVPLHLAEIFLKDGEQFKPLHPIISIGE